MNWMQKELTEEKKCSIMDMEYNPPLRRPGDTSKHILFANDFEKIAKKVLSFRFFKK